MEALGDAVVLTETPHRNDGFNPIPTVLSAPY